MAQLPDKMGRLHRRSRLLVSQPHQHPPGMRRRRRRRIIRLAGRLHQKMPIQRQRRGQIVRGGVRSHNRRGDQIPNIISAHMPRLHKRPLDIKTVHLVQHTLHQPLNRILRRTIRPQPWHAQRARRRAENQIPARAPFPKMRQRQLNHVQRAGEIGLELVPDVEFVLVLAGADHAVAGAIGDDVNATEARDGLVDDGLDGFARADVAEQAEAVVVLGFELFHAFGAILVGAADSGDEVVAC